MDELDPETATARVAAETGYADIARLVDAIDLPIARWDTGFRLSFCNPCYRRWAGLGDDALLGRSVAEIYGDDAWQVAASAFARVLAGETLSYDRLADHGGRGPRWTRFHVFPESAAAGGVQAVWAIAFDVHDDIVLRNELQAAQRQLDRFTEHIPYPLTYVDREFRLRFVNRAYTLAAGAAREQLLGRRIGEIRGARRWAEHRPFFERALGGEACEYTRLADLAHLGPRWTRTSYTPDFDAQGRVVGIYTSTVDVHELTLAQQALRRSVERDALTDVLTRRALMDALGAAVGRAGSEPVALYFVDLDRFKQINDAHGHRAGDEVLVTVARALQGAVRARDEVGRFGGDEFVVIAAVPDRAGALALARHLLDAVRAAAGARPECTVSIGFALAPLDAGAAFDLLRLADDAMYAAKHAGGDCVRHCADGGER